MILNYFIVSIKEIDLFRFFIFSLCRKTRENDKLAGRFSICAVLEEKKNMNFSFSNKSDKTSEFCWMLAVSVVRSVRLAHFFFHLYKSSNKKKTWQEQERRIDILLNSGTFNLPVNLMSVFFSSCCFFIVNRFLCILRSKYDRNAWFS